MLARSLNEIYENLRDFVVYDEGKGIIGCVGLHISWEDLAEIKSLAVKEERRRQGIGGRLLDAVLEEAKALEIARVFVLTYEPEFFKKYGFLEVDKLQLPHKIWNECINCIKFPNCTEVALTRTVTL
jgi:amino-acid N-acetyltransferase